MMKSQIILLLLLSVFSFCFSYYSCFVAGLSTIINDDGSSRRGGRRNLPEKVLVAYTTDCNDSVIKAVQDGVNVVIWSFMEIIKENSPTSSSSSRVTVNTNSLDLDCIRRMITSLDKEGYENVIHLVSFGGWNGPHLEPKLTSVEWYNHWKDSVGDIFHGIDWDLEGHDNLKSPTNVFTINCLEKMGTVSKMAKDDGYIIGIAPPQSYLDVQNSKFSRYVNLTDPDRPPWHDDFHYFGSNVYAYLLAKYGPYIDFVSIQFYESYSRAAMSLYYDHIPQHDYLTSYVNELVKKKNNNNDDDESSFFVNFEDDPTIELSNQRVSLPLSKLVFGFANGWAINNHHNDNKHAYFDPSSIQLAYKRLSSMKRQPRGFMFWVIGEEGTNEIHYARELNKILQTQHHGSDQRIKE